MFYLHKRGLYSSLCFVIALITRLSQMSESGESGTQKKVLLISVDGFRWDFINKTSTPNLDAIIRNGVTSEYVINVFPTSTIPNHQTIVTGLYPENHGMINNNFIDPITGKRFAGLSGNIDIGWWNQSSPIWTADEQQGHRSGVLFWPGSRVPYEGILPSFLPSHEYSAPYEPGEHTIPIIARIDMALEWLAVDDVNLVVVYTEEPDDTVHEYGPDSNDTRNIGEVERAIQLVDNWVGYLNRRLSEYNLVSIVDVIIIGDHGHVTTSSEQNVNLDNIMCTKDFLRYTGADTNLFIYPKPGLTQCVYEKLKDAGELRQHYKVYLKQDIPEYLHIKNNSRTPDILLLPDIGWTATTTLRTAMVPYLQGDWYRGDHGYDIKHKDMNPAFFAYGPSFKKGYRKKCVHMVDMYGLMCRILNITCRSNDGRMERIQSLLVDGGGNEDVENEDTIESECKIQ